MIAPRIIAADPTGTTWTWDVEHDADSDRNPVTFHRAIAEDGRSRLIGLSTHYSYGAEHFRTLVEQGFPVRPGPVICPWLPEELEALQREVEACCEAA